MGLHALLVLALISTAAAAPWRCYRTADGSTVCFGDEGQPTINPPSVCLNRPSPPCSGPATVYTPSQCPPPCPPPRNPCDPCPPCPCDPCSPCLY